MSIKRADGKAYSLDLSTLTAADRAYLRAWKAKASLPSERTATTDSDIVATVSIVADTSTTDDTPAATYTPKVGLSNRESKANFKGLKGTLVLVAQASDNPQKFMVLAVQKLTCDLAAQGKFDYTGEPSPVLVVAARPGRPVWRYRGYMFVLQNAEGNILQFHHSRALLKSAAEALKLEPGVVFFVHSALDRSRAQSAPDPAAEEKWAPYTSVLPLHLPQ